MTRTARLTALVASLVVAQLGVTGSVTADGLTRPAKDVPFDACGADAAKEFCVEGFWYGANADALSPIDVKTGAFDGTWASDPNSPYVYAKLSNTYSGPTSGVSELGPHVFLTVKKHSGFEYAGGGPNYVGLDDGVYRVKVRLGDFDPTYAIIWADPSSYIVTKGDDGYFTLDMTFDPIPYLGVNNATTCVSLKWGTGCEAESTYRNYMFATLAMAGNTVNREKMRGWWLATNATRFTLLPPTVDPVNKEVKQSFSVAAPHYVPVAFEPYSGGAVEGTREMYPVLYKIFAPYTGIIQNVKSLTGVDVDKTIIDDYVSTPGRLFKGTIQSAAGVEVDTAITVTPQTEGLLIDFDIDHYSAPNPALRVVDPGRARSTLKNGALLNVLRSTSKGKTYSAAVLVGPGSGAKVAKISSKSPKNCTVKGTSVKMTKAGTCKLQIVVDKGTGKSKKTATATISIPIS